MGDIVQLKPEISFCCTELNLEVAGTHLIAAFFGINDSRPIDAVSKTIFHESDCRASCCAQHNHAEHQGVDEFVCHIACLPFRLLRYRVNRAIFVVLK